MQMMTTRETMYEERRRYITGTLKEAMSVIPDFGDIQYVHEFNTDQEYVKIYDIIGGVLFLDVTGVPLDVVLMDVACVILHNTPARMITDMNKKREIGRLFIL